MANPRKPNSAPAAAKYLGAGLTWVGSTGLFMYLGSRLDEAWGSKPLCTVVGALVGGAAGFYYLYRQLIESTRRSGHDRKTDRKE
jgi:F0F1-type ATP synthase assembly protein I